MKFLVCVLFSVKLLGFDNLILQPSSGQSVHGKFNVVLDQITAGISRVEFRCDSKTIAQIDPVKDLKTEIDSNDLTNGFHEIIAIYYDLNSSIRYSDPIIINVYNKEQEEQNDINLATDFSGALPSL